MTTLPPVGSAEFMVIWKALQQFIDNSEEVLLCAAEGEYRALDGQENLPAEVGAAQAVVDQMAAQFVMACDTLAA